LALNLAVDKVFPCECYGILTLNCDYIWRCIVPRNLSIVCCISVFHRLY